MWCGVSSGWRWQWWWRFWGKRLAASSPSSSSSSSWSALTVVSATVSWRLGICIYIFLAVFLADRWGGSVRADAPGTGCCVNPFGGRLTECSRSSRGGSRRMRDGPSLSRSHSFLKPTTFVCVKVFFLSATVVWRRWRWPSGWMGGGGGGRGWYPFKNKRKRGRGCGENKNRLKSRQTCWKIHVCVSVYVTW